MHSTHLFIPFILCVLFTFIFITPAIYQTTAIMNFLTRLPFDHRVELLSQIEMGTNMLPLMKTSPPMIPA
ncbi:Uncharacterized protein HZ326_19563 [Fusarium oxysporum f. sp. albedinis]|nr:Uncharacterized protein HZ326_19563 [Fusarium oxysporum f. sp. albedinis]